jgi:Family of unknown function (DUF6228)
VAILRLESNNGDTVIIDSLGTSGPLKWHVTMQAAGLSADAEVDLDGAGYIYYFPPLAEYFSSIATDWRGWPGVKTWGRNPLSFEATHDGLGHIALTIVLSQPPCVLSGWRAQVTLNMDAGRLDAISRAAATF